MAGSSNDVRDDDTKLAGPTAEEEGEADPLVGPVPPLEASPCETQVHNSRSPASKSSRAGKADTSSVSSSSDEGKPHNTRSMYSKSMVP